MCLLSTLSGASVTEELSFFIGFFIRKATQSLWAYYLLLPVSPLSTPTLSFQGSMHSPNTTLSAGDLILFFWVVHVDGQLALTSWENLPFIPPSWVCLSLFPLYINYIYNLYILITPRLSCLIIYQAEYLQYVAEHILEKFIIYLDREGINQISI